MEINPLEENSAFAAAIVFGILEPGPGGEAKLIGKGVTNATGQLHHLLSNKIAGALNDHPLLKGVFSRDDPRFMYNALDGAAHKGYQTWHSQYDKMVVDYIEAYPNLTPSKFQSYLHDLYQQPWLQQQIPNVNLKW